MRQALKFVGGSVAVYVVMAACSMDPPKRYVDRGTGGTRMTASNGGTSSREPNGGEPADGGMMGMAGERMGADPRGGGAGSDQEPRDAGVMDAIADAMTDPVPDAAADPNTSGDRLRARYLVATDGARQFMGWRDTERDEDCAFTKTADSETRCIPSSTLYASGYFSDSDCTQPYFSLYAPAGACSGATAPKYGYLASCSGVQLFRLTPASPDEVFVGTATTTCTRTMPPDGYAFFTGAEQDLDDWVSARYEVE